MKGQNSTLAEFWPFYVSQHLNPINRRLHFYGMTWGLLLGLAAIIGHTPILAFGAPVAAYGLAWFGHFFYEKNRPATFTYPLLSLRADMRMYRLTLLGEMDTEILSLTTELKGLSSAPP